MKHSEYAWVALILLICYLLVNMFSEAGPNSDHAVRELLASDLFRNCRIDSSPYEVTAYCPGACCNTGIAFMNDQICLVDWSDQVAVGSLSLRSLLNKGIKVAAVDPYYIPMGSILLINDSYYVALDSGSAIKGYVVDISVPTHAEALRHGRKFNQGIKVYVPENPQAVVEGIKRLFVSDLAAN